MLAAGRCCGQGIDLCPERDGPASVNVEMVLIAEGRAVEPSVCLSREPHFAEVEWIHQRRAVGCESLILENVIVESVVEAGELRPVFVVFEHKLNIQVDATLLVQIDVAEDVGVGRVMKPVPVQLICAGETFEIADAHVP